MQVAGSKGGRPRTRGERGGRTAGDRRRPHQGQAPAPTPLQALHSLPSRDSRDSRNSRKLSPEVETELAGIAAGAGCELLHVEWKGGVLRLVLDRVPAPSEPAGGATEAAGPAQAGSGVSLGDCEQVAKQASALLDVLDFGGGRYVLEVSSPGLDRQLYRPSDYRRFQGRLARVAFETPGQAGRAVRRTVVARLGEMSGGDAAETVTLVEARSGERIIVRLADVRQARLELEL
jgi:ribosome maturation factor RimP